MKNVVLSNEDFQDFPIGEFPYDKDHTAMGEYQYVVENGYHGNWVDMVCNYTYKISPGVCETPGECVISEVYASGAIKRTMTAFCACSLFSASSKISLACCSNTFAVISSSRCAGRQCITIASDLAEAITASLI